MVRPIATRSPSWRFFKRARWAFHGRATPDFEPGRGLVYLAHYQPGTLNALVNHPSGCSRLLPRFLAAGEKISRARAYVCACVRARAMVDRLNCAPSRENRATKCLRACKLVLRLDSPLPLSRTSYGKENCPYCLYVGHSSDICLTLRNAFPLNARSAILLPTTVRVKMKLRYMYRHLYGQL